MNPNAELAFSLLKTDVMTLAEGASVLVTGVSGLVGSAVANALMVLNGLFDLKLKLFGMARDGDRIDRMFGHTSLCRIATDVSRADLEELPSFDIIIHAASPVGPKAFHERPAEVVRANLCGTVNLLEKAVRSRASRFIFVSTHEVYGEGRKIWREEDSGVLAFLNSRACYPEAKRAAENACICFGRQYGLDVRIVRLSRLYGQAMNFESGLFIADFMKDVMARRAISITGDGSLVRPILHIDDAVRGMIRVLFSGSSGLAYNISPDESWTIGEIAAKMGRLSGLGHVGEVGEIAERVPRQDNSRLRALGWQQRILLCDGLKEMVTSSNVGPL